MLQDRAISDPGRAGLPRLAAGDVIALRRVRGLVGLRFIRKRQAPSTVGSLRQRLELHDAQALGLGAELRAYVLSGEGNRVVGVVLQRASDPH